MQFSIQITNYRPRLLRAAVFVIYYYIDVNNKLVSRYTIYLLYLTLYI